MVKHALAKEGQIDLVEDPQFVSIHADDADTTELPIASNDLDIDKRLIIKEFMANLREAIDSLPFHQKQLLCFSPFFCFQPGMVG